MRDALHIPLYIAGEPVSLLKVTVCKRHEVTLRKNGQGKQGQCHESLYNKRNNIKTSKTAKLYKATITFTSQNNSNKVKREEKKKTQIQNNFNVLDVQHREDERKQTKNSSGKKVN